MSRRVSTTGPSSVIATVCSMCAPREPSWLRNDPDHPDAPDAPEGAEDLDPYFGDASVDLNRARSTEPAEPADLASTTAAPAKQTPAKQAPGKQAGSKKAPAKQAGATSGPATPRTRRVTRISVD